MSYHTLFLSLQFFFPLSLIQVQNSTSSHFFTFHAWQTLFLFLCSITWQMFPPINYEEPQWMHTQRGVTQTTTWFMWQLQMYPSHISSMIRKTLWQEKPQETREGNSQPSGRREEEEDVVSDPRQSPGTAIKPAHSARNYAMACRYWSSHCHVLFLYK